MCGDCSKCKYSYKLKSMGKNWNALPLNCLVVFLKQISTDCYLAKAEKMIPSDCSFAVGEMVYYLRSAAGHLDYVLKNKHFKD